VLFLIYRVAIRYKLNYIIDVLNKQEMKMTNIKQDTTLTEVEIITALIDVAVTGVLEQRGYKGGEDFIVNIDTDETGIEVYISYL